MKQQDRSFIDWFILVYGKINRSRHQRELKIYERYFVLHTKTIDDYVFPCYFFKRWIKYGCKVYILFIILFL